MPYRVEKAYQRAAKRREALSTVSDAQQPVSARHFKRCTSTKALDASTTLKDTADAIKLVDILPLPPAVTLGSIGDESASTSTAHGVEQTHDEAPSSSSQLVRDTAPSKSSNPSIQTEVLERSEALHVTVTQPLLAGEQAAVNRPDDPQHFRPAMSELLQYILQHEEAFRRYSPSLTRTQAPCADIDRSKARLASLYSDFRLQRATNPDGYQANIKAWQKALTNATRAGVLPSANALLVLRTDEDLIRALESRDWGRPLALGAVIVSTCPHQI